MVDVRIYIGTLVAVLIFFGLGILVGLGIAREPTAEQLYQRIERQLQRYREETAKELLKRDERIRQLEGELSLLNQRVQSNEQFLNKLLPSLVHQRLRFRNIAFLADTPEVSEELTEQVRSLLQKAGAQVPLSLTLLPDAIIAADEATWQKVAAGLGLVMDKVEADTLQAGVWKRVAMLLRYGDPQNSWRPLEQAGWVRVQGSTQTPVGSVVFFVAAKEVGKEEHFQKVEAPLLKAMRSVGMRVVVASTTDADPKIIGLYQTNEWSTVSHIDTPLGLLSLVASLQGHVDHYGVWGSARRPFPDMEWVFQPTPP